MYRLFKILSLIALVLTLLTVSSEAAKKNVAVMPIYVSSTAVQNGTETMIYNLVAENMTSQLIVVLHNSDDYAAIEREEVKQQLEKFEIQAVRIAASPLIYFSILQRCWK